MLFFFFSTLLMEFKIKLSLLPFLLCNLLGQGENEENEFFTVLFYVLYFVVLIGDMSKLKGANSNYQ
jgi:hypothetical protein